MTNVQIFLYNKKGIRKKNKVIGQIPNRFIELSNYRVIESSNYRNIELSSHRPSPLPPGRAGEGVLAGVRVPYPSLRKSNISNISSLSAV